MTKPPTKSRPKKTSTSAKSPRKPRTTKNKKKPKASFIHNLWSLGWKLALISALLIGFYCIYLDQIIARKFEGQKWYLPAQVFSRSMALYPGAAISHQQLIAELNLLGYRKVANPRQIGEYAASATRVEVWRRAFFHPNGQQNAMRALVDFNDLGVAGVYRATDARELAVLHLEPMLLDRIIPKQDDEDRLFVPSKAMPKTLVTALLLTEDREFYQHYGVNPIAIARAAWVNITAGKTVQGGSTLTQQLAKNFFLSSERSITRKIREALMAIIIDARYSKQEILEAYLNEVYMGQDGKRAIHGMGLASQFYFGRPIGELTLAQQAFLVAVIKGPSFYNPWRSPERAQSRRDLVLRLLLHAGKISSTEYDLSASSPLGLRHEDRPVHQKLPAFFAAVRQELNQRYGKALLEKSGLKIYTTLDPIAQEAAEKAVKYTLASLDDTSKELQVGMVVTDRFNAGIAAIVGDRNPSFDGFNRAQEIRRPIGSLVKPFIYVTALEQGDKYSLATMLKDKPITLTNGRGKTWSPQNVDRKYRQQVPLLTGLIKSINVPTVNLGMSLGLTQVSATLKAAGWSDNIEHYPSLLLGAINGSPRMVAQVYQTLADGGRYQALHAITQVLDQHNKILHPEPTDTYQAVPQEADYLIQYAMTQVVQHGTAHRLGQIYPNIRLAGKTGTSNDSRDSWFAGYDERNVAAIWVGRDDNRTTHLYGSSGAMAVYQNFLKQRPPVGLRLAPVDGVITGYFNRLTGKAVDKDCADVEALPALSQGYKPTNCGKTRSWWQRLVGN